MRLAGLAFLAGVLIAGYFPEYPLLTIAPLPLLLHMRLRLLLAPVIIFFCAGGVWLMLYLNFFSPPVLPLSMDSQPVRVTGRIVSIPRVSDNSTRFVFEIHEVEQPAVNWHGKVSLNWYHAVHELVPGQQWRFMVKLKPAHGYANPGGFDYEGWLFSKGISATGYVRQADSAMLLETEFSPHAYRQSLSASIRALTGKAEFSGILVALVTGDRQYISAAQWQTLSRTGTSHLMAISGLHVGLVYGLFYFLGSWCWRCRASLMLFRPAQDVGVLTGFIGALIYAGLAGFSIPTLRALIMVSVLALVMWRRQRTSPLDVLQTAVVLVLLYDPLAFLSAGFWLSFVAVALILFMHVSERSRARASFHGLFRLVRVQWVLGLGMLPLTSLLFSQVSVIAPIMNLLAVPWVGLLVVPVTLLASVFTTAIPGLASLMLLLADSLVQLLWEILLPASSSEYAVIYPAHPSWWVVVCSSMGLVLLLFQHNGWLRGPGALLLLPLFFSSAERPGYGEYQVDVLDVGQGLAVVIRTASHTLLYDAGFSSQSGFDIGRQVVLPYLWHQGIAELDHVVLSHDDRDHTGGFPAVAAAMPIHQLTVMPGSRFLHRSSHARACFAGQRWHWDGIEFLMMHPAQGTAGSENNRSCVLRVSGPGGRVLLTGDIEENAEHQLVANHGYQLSADILLAPHHGSTTSSSADFIEHVRPLEVVYSAGFRNRYGFPRPEVTVRYELFAARQHVTADTGMLRYHFSHEPGRYTRYSHRNDRSGFRFHVAKQQSPK